VTTLPFSLRLCRDNETETRRGDNIGSSRVGYAPGAARGSGRHPRKAARTAFRALTPPASEDAEALGTHRARAPGTKGPHTTLEPSMGDRIKLQSSNEL